MVAIYNPQTATNFHQFTDAMEAAAAPLNISVVKATVHEVSEIEPVLASIAKIRGSGLVVLPDIFMVRNRDLLATTAGRYQLPAIYPVRYFAAAGGLISYGAEPTEAFRLTASYVDRILKGSQPGDLPVQQTTRFELVMNLKAAKTLGLTILPSLLARVDEVIE
jgi:putative ABC transport system substrate-binding protein